MLNHQHEPISLFVNSDKKKVLQHQQGGGGVEEKKKNNREGRIDAILQLEKEEEFLFETSSHGSLFPACLVLVLVLVNNNQSNQQSDRMNE